MIDGEFYPEGITVGIPYWPYYRNPDIYGPDAEVFRPERWLSSSSNFPASSLSSSSPPEQLEKIKAAFTPFLKGPGSCLGKGIALLELCMTIARTVWRMEIRALPGDRTGECKGEGKEGLFEIWDAYLSLREGPVVQVRGRKGI